MHIYSLMLFCRENQHSRTDDGALTLGEGVVMKVSYDNSLWYDYDGTNRRRYMNTVEPQPRDDAVLFDMVQSAPI